METLKGLEALEKLEQLAEARNNKPAKNDTAVVTAKDDDEIAVINPPIGYRFVQLREKNMYNFYQRYDLKYVDKTRWETYHRGLMAAACSGFFEEPRQLKVTDVFNVSEEEQKRIERELGELLPDTTVLLFDAVSNHVSRAGQIPKN